MQGTATEQGTQKLAGSIVYVELVSSRFLFLLRWCSYLLFFNVYVEVALRGPRSEEINCSADICEEIVSIPSAPSCSAATDCATVQQRIEWFLKEMCEETWLFSLTR